mmetsp:Transcript_142372/g.248273  ORF Transcript_142372/g.248273 Transcript_142372/m.248273 type:complete len:261 (+) Transcript_142372:2813-3595(+)
MHCPRGHRLGRSNGLVGLVPILVQEGNHNAQFHVLPIFVVEQVWNPCEAPPEGNLGIQHQLVDDTRLHIAVARHTPVHSKQVLGSQVVLLQWIIHNPRAVFDAQLSHFDSCRPGTERGRQFDRRQHAVPVSKFVVHFNPDGLDIVVKRLSTAMCVTDIDEDCHLTCLLHLCTIERQLNGLHVSPHATILVHQSPTLRGLVAPVHQILARGAQTVLVEAEGQNVQLHRISVRVRQPIPVYTHPQVLVHLNGPVCIHLVPFG